MKRILNLFAFLLISVIGIAQAPSNYTNINGRYRWIAGMFDSTFSIPKGSIPSLRTGGSTNPGAVFYNTSDSSIYVYSGTQWIKQASGSGFVPYVGANQDVDLGTFSLNAKSLHIKGTGGQGHLGLKFQSGVPNMSVNESGIYADANGNLGIKIDNAYTSIFKTSLNTADRTYTLENKNYTIGDSADIAVRVKYTDTASMLNPYLKKIDTASLSNRINLKVNISDTASMLSPYARTNTVNAGLATKLNISDTSTMLNPYLRKIDTASLSNRINLKVNISDTATMLSPYARKNFINAGTGISYSSVSGTITNTAPDQTVVLNNGTGISISGTYPNFTITNTSPSSGGTVTQVNSGTGLTGGPITTSGTLAVDTLLMSTRAWRQKGVDSLQANINTKVNISDTASMLSPYARTNAVNAGLALKVNISDTASMLTPYLRKVDTASLSNRINLKVNISDTATMLSPYARTNVVNAGLALKVNISDTSSMLNPYLRKIDTASLSNRINLKVNISDTATMLSPYLRTNVAAATYTPQTRTITINGTSQDLSANRTFNVGTVTSVATGYGTSGGTITTSGTIIVDSATLSNYYLRRKDSLTATNVLGYVTKKILADTASAIRSADAGGTVTSVATSTGTGITGGTITTSGTIAADTVLLSTRKWRQKGIDSVQANVNAKVNISDTATMLSPYLRTNVASATYTPLTRTLTINGTALDLSANRSWSVGTVTSITGGTGLSGGAITTSGTLAVDTLLMSTRAWRQKGIDSVAALANTKVSSVAGTSPIASSGGTSPTISITQSGAGSDGYLSSTDWNKFNSAVPAGTPSVGDYVYYNGSNLAYRALQATSPLSYNGTTGTYSIAQASGSANGYLSSTDWTTFNNKQNALTNPVTGTGTTNYLPKFTGTSTIGNSLIYDNGTNVGINSTTFTYAAANRTNLVLNGTTSSLLEFQNGGSASAYLYSNSANFEINATGSKSIYLSTNGSIRATLDASGNLGLGVTPSAWNTVTPILQIGTASFYGYQTQARVSANYYYESADKYIQNGYATSYLQSSGQHSWFNAPSGTAGNAISFTQAMTLFSTGNLAVGTTTDAGYKLDVAGSLRSTTSAYFATSSGSVGIGTTSPSNKLTVNGTNIGIDIQNSGTTYFRTELDGGNTTYISTIGAYDMILRTNSTERMRITSGGDVGIGTTSPGAKLEVNGAIKTATVEGNNPAWKLGAYGTAIASSNGYAVAVDIGGTTYYLMTAYLPEPTPEAQAGPSNGYKTKFEEPVIRLKSDSQRVKDLEKEVIELKEMMKKMMKK